MEIDEELMENLAKDPITSNPLFRSALRYLQREDWKRGTIVVDNLRESDPQNRILIALRQVMQFQSLVKGDDHFNTSLYPETLKAFGQMDWDRGLKLVKVLVDWYPFAKDIPALPLNPSYPIVENLERRPIRPLLILLAVLCSLLVLVLGVSLTYMLQPTPLTGILAPLKNVDYPPHYLFSIYSVDEPGGVGLSPDGDRIYVAETGGARQVRIFDRSGDQLGAFVPPFTTVGERAPVYLATDPFGRVYVTDRMQHAIFIFSAGGEYIDTLLGPDLTLSEYVALHTNGDQTDDPIVVYNLFDREVIIQGSEQVEAPTSGSSLPDWSPMGIRIDPFGSMFLSDVTKGKNQIIEVTGIGNENVNPEGVFNPKFQVYGSSGNGDGELLFPNVAMADSQGRVYISDGNNGRISAWDNQGNFLFNFGNGLGDGAISLPRGLFIDQRDRLHVVDAVGQNIKVYDVSGQEPTYLYSFGDLGLGDGQFNFPNDIAIDRTGRLYIADRANNRIQVWSY